MNGQITLSQLKARLSPQQQAAAELIVANEFATKGEKKTYEEIAEEVGVAIRTLYNWRQSPDFTRYMSVISDNKLDNYRALADAQLIKLIKGTSNNGIPAIKALELYYKLSGKLVDRRESVVVNESDRKPRVSREEVEKELDKLNDILN